MSQQGIIDFLEENKGNWFTAKGIMSEFNVNRNSIERALRQLRKYEEVESRPRIRSWIRYKPPLEYCIGGKNERTNK